MELLDRRDADHRDTHRIDNQAVVGRVVAFHEDRSSRRHRRCTLNRDESSDPVSGERAGVVNENPVGSHDAARHRYALVRLGEHLCEDRVVASGHDLVITVTVALSMNCAKAGPAAM